MKISLFLALVFSSTVFYAQNLKPGNSSSIAFQVPPKNLDHLAQTKIYVQARYSQDAQYVYIVENAINKEVYTLYASEAEADWKIVFHTRNSQSVPLKQRYETSTSKDKAGNPITTYTYYAESTEKYEAHFELVDKSGAILQRYDIAETFLHQKTSKVSARAALDDYNNTRMRAIEEHIQGAVLSQFKKLQDDYLVAKQTLALYPMEVKSRKFDYADMNEAALLMENWMKSNPTDLSDPNVLKAIQLYEEALKEFEPESKKTRVNDEIAAVCYYALACTNFITKNYPKANEQILKSEELDKRIHFSQEMLKDNLQLLKDRKVYN